MKELEGLHNDAKWEVARLLFHKAAETMLSLQPKVAPYVISNFCDEAQLLINKLRRASKTPSSNTEPKREPL